MKSLLGNNTAKADSMTEPTTLNLPALSAHLENLFGVPAVDSYSQLVGGYKCRNFRLNCGPEVFFLKQYRGRVSHWVAEIKHAEDHFAKHGIPIILPMKDRHDRTIFYFDHEWFSLFPYVDRVPPTASELTGDVMASMGEMLGRIHLAGSEQLTADVQRIRGWDAQAFHAECVELEQALGARSDECPIKQLVKKTLALKADLVARNTTRRADIPLADDHLIHGDFIYQNVFLDDEGRVAHVFDLEKACVAPRAYELARSLMINCFDDGWTDRNLELGRRFLSAYRSVYPVSFEEFTDGVRMYMIHVAHMTWIEGRLLLTDARPEHLTIYEAHARRMEHVGGDHVAFCEAIYAS